MDWCPLPGSCGDLDPGFGVWGIGLGGLNLFLKSRPPFPMPNYRGSGMLLSCAQYPKKTKTTTPLNHPPSQCAHRPGVLSLRPKVVGLGALGL